MKKSQLIALTALTTAIAVAGTTIYLLKKRSHRKRMIAISNAGYEMAYDLHFPVKYKKQRTI